MPGFTRVQAMSALLAAAALLACASAQAGKIVSETATDGRRNFQILEFNDKGQLRVTGEGIDSMGMIVRDRRIYLFGEVKGKPLVADLLAAVKMAEAQGKKRPDSDPNVEEIASIVPTGRKQTIAGIEGEVHTVTWVLAGKRRSEEAVLTRDPRLAAVIQGLSLDPGVLSQKPRKAELDEQAHAMGAFLLKAPNRVVTSAEFGPSPDARFTLRATPSDDPKVVGEILFSAMFGALQEVGKAMAGAMQETGKAVAGATLGGTAPAATAPSGDASLHDAAWDGDEAQVKTLLAKGADLDARVEEGETALHFAAFKGRTVIARLLLDKGADANARKKDGATPLGLAAFNGHKEVAELLLAKGADLKARTLEGDTALHMAAYKGETAVAEVLIARGADVNAAKEDGDTALHLAAYKGEREVVQLLLAKGADAKLKNKAGETAAQLAQQQGERGLVALLGGEPVGSAAAQAGGRPAGNAKVSYKGIGDDIDACSEKKMSMSQCRTVLVRTYGKPKYEDATTLYWDKVRGADSCYSFSINYESDKKSRSGYRVTSASCD